MLHVVPFNFRTVLPVLCLWAMTVFVLPRGNVLGELPSLFHNFKLTDGWRKRRTAQQHIKSFSGTSQTRRETVFGTLLQHEAEDWNPFLQFFCFIAAWVLNGCSSCILGHFQNGLSTGVVVVQVNSVGFCKCEIKCKTFCFETLNWKR